MPESREVNSSENTGKLGWFSSIFKQQAPKNPDSPELQSKITAVQQDRFTSSDVSPPTSFFGKMALSLKNWSKKSKADGMGNSANTDTTRKAEGQRSRIPSLTQKFQAPTSSPPPPLNFLFADSNEAKLFTPLNTPLPSNPNLFQDEPTTKAQFESASYSEQEEMVKSNPALLRGAKQEIQEHLLDKNPSLSEFADPEIQFQKANANPKRFLFHVDVDVQLKLLQNEGPKVLKYASQEVQQSYLYTNPVYYKFASEAIQMDPRIVKRGEAYRKVCQNGLDLQTLKEYQEDPIIAEAAVRQNHKAFQFVKGRVAVTKVLQYIHKELKPYENPQIQIDPIVKNALATVFPLLYKKLK